MGQCDVYSGGSDRHVSASGITETLLSPEMLCLMCVTKRRHETQDGRKHRDGRNQRNTPRRTASLTTQTSIVAHATTTPTQRVHQPPPPGTLHTSTEPQSDPQRRDPQHPYHPFLRSTRKECTVSPAGMEGMPSVPRQTGLPHHT
jgi:hypothetical protein